MGLSEDREMTKTYPLCLSDFSTAAAGNYKHKVEKSQTTAATRRPGSHR